MMISLFADNLIFCVSGDRCEFDRRQGRCVPGVCRNGGTCRELSGGGFRCECPAGGFERPYCSVSAMSFPPKSFAMFRGLRQRFHLSISLRSVDSRKGFKAHNYNVVLWSLSSPIPHRPASLRLKSITIPSLILASLTEYILFNLFISSLCGIDPVTHLCQLSPLRREVSQHTSLSSVNLLVSVSSL